jgi:hypothetical protein
MNAATIGPGGFFVEWVGNDGLWGTGDDALVTSGTFSYRADDNTAQLSFSAPLTAGVYRVVVGSPLADLAGNIAATTSWTFYVLGEADSDQDGVPDAQEVALGFDPNNPDSDGDGILDGDEDQDGDVLTTRWELLLGYNPTNPDSDGDGISDGLEDFDGDTLSNQSELALGTSPKSSDTDGDGWNDEAEITAGSSPTDPFSRPMKTFVAAPSSELSLPRMDVTGGLAFNVTIARPPIDLMLPRLDSTGGLPWNTTLAAPPISIALPIPANPSAPWNVTIGQPPVQLEWGP